LSSISRNAFDQIGDRRQSLDNKTLNLVY